MHKGRITLAILAGIGFLLIVFPWMEETVNGSKVGFPNIAGSEVYYGFQTWYGQMASLLFAVIALFALIGKRDTMIAKGFPKMTVLATSGILFLEGIVIFSITGFSTHFTAQAGVYGILILALATAVAPYLFKADGTVHIPNVKDVVDDIEDSADIVEDKFEDISDKVEDKAEGIMDKIEDKFDGDDDKDEDQKNEKSSENITKNDPKV
ncbi:MAG: hypothetical protein ABJG68_08765 [Crocinitomicaceae bacterium]